MTARTFVTRLVGLSVLSLSLTGCVSQEKYNALKLERDRFAEQLGQAQTEASAARSEAEAYKSQIAAIMQGGTGKEAMLVNLSNENAELKKQLDELNRQYADAVGKIGTGNALPEPLTNELQAFANANPDLVEFDAARGIVKFKSDLTFATGSAELTPKAKDAIGRFSQILNSGSAAGYELMVAGHTDNTRVVNPQTIAAGHKDNWYLSAHRAISVGSALQSQRVNPQRIAVTGYADQRPVASNMSESGKTQNRRVEVLILPTTVRTSSPSIANTGGGAKQTATKANKDSSAGNDTRFLNK
jgi:chemotaxis protein MotB